MAGRQHPGQPVAKKKNCWDANLCLNLIGAILTASRTVMTMVTQCPKPASQSSNEIYKHNFSLGDF